MATFIIGLHSDRKLPIKTVRTIILTDINYAEAEKRIEKLNRKRVDSFWKIDTITK